MVGSLGLEPRPTELTNLRTLPCRVSGLAAPMLHKVLELFIQIPYTESLPIYGPSSGARTLDTRIKSPVLYQLS